MSLLIHNPTGVGAMMRTVIYALIPGIGVSLWIYGWGPLINIAIAVTSALVAETVVLMLRQRPVLAALGDYSATLTALVLALVLPPLLPGWLPMIGAVFAIVVAKHLYGGLGHNPFNPAMAGYALLLLAFPTEITHWPELLTPWDKSLTNIAFLMGGLWLIAKRVISWHIPIAMLISMALLATVFWLWSPSLYPMPLFYLFSGTTMLGAFFIATDPVTACTTDRGRLWFGMGSGILVYMIGNFCGYPDAIAFAILIMNMAAPTIDRYSRPRVFGHNT
ncbi:MAG TPA: electron transport complex subunit RsxD [Acidiferrobacteraceae bacterium]|nr:electron transport complex subunit RsxD [Acidiferrobacteraceae bacterium]